jgi:hypothetical protein
LKPFIYNKIEKTFIDYFLLNHEKKLEEYSSVENISLLNALEISLLLIYVHPKDKQLAKALYEYIENKNKLINYEIN